MEVCYVYVTHCSGVACLTPIWNRVDRKVDRCFTNVHYLWDWGDPHRISQASASATVGRVLTLYSVCVSMHTYTHTHLLLCVCGGGYWLDSWMYSSFFFFLHVCSNAQVFAYVFVFRKCLKYSLKCWIGYLWVLKSTHRSDITLFISPETKDPATFQQQPAT